jgi:serine protease SohB
MPDAWMWDTLGFAAKSLVVVVAFGVSTALVAMLFRRRRGVRRGHLEVQKLNERFEALGDAVDFGAHRKSRGELKKLQKARRAKAKGEKPASFVLDFDGDLFATGVESLREEVTAVLAAAREQDEVVVRLESSGGAVSHYGLAASQLARLREKKLSLTICIDRVAASGGYMMAAVANTIVAAPFSVIGSIGVIAEVPNVHRLLKRHDIDFEEATAGEFKRTVSFFAEITEAGRKKFQEQLEETHRLFKDFVKTHRPNLQIDQVSTGEFWLASRALELGLVDRLGTSDDYLLAQAKERELFRVKFIPQRPLRDRLSHLVAEAVDRSVLKLFDRLLRLELR